MKARPADRNFGRERSPAGLHASRDSFYRTARGKRQHRAGVIPLDLLPRRCPVCRNDTIIGHGRRRRQSHDDRHDCIWVTARNLSSRAGRPSRSCPTGWRHPAHYSLHCRQQACERIAAGDSAEQAAPHCKDPSTLARSIHRASMGTTTADQRVVLGDGRNSRCMHFLRTPTILAWDLGALCRILPIEARSP